MTIGNDVAYTYHAPAAAGAAANDDDTTTMMRIIMIRTRSPIVVVTMITPMSLACLNPRPRFFLLLQLT